MTPGKCVLYLVAILGTLNIVLAEKASNQDSQDSGFPDLFHLPSEERRSGFNFEGIFPVIPGLETFQNAFKPFAQFFGGGNSGSSNNVNSESTTAAAARRKRSPEDENSNQNGYSYSHSFSYPPGQSQQGQGEKNFFGNFPQFPDFSSGFQNPLGGFQNAFSGFLNSNRQPFIPLNQFFGGSNSDGINNEPDSSSTNNESLTRRKRSPADDSDSISDESDESVGRVDQPPQEEEDHKNRLFFGSLFTTRFVTCNYTTQAGSSCTSCNTALTCFSSNVGRQRSCFGFFPYCNNGRCSFIPGAQCTSSTTTTTTTAASSTTTTAASTSTTTSSTTTTAAPVTTTASTTTTMAGTG